MRILPRERTGTAILGLVKRFDAIVPEEPGIERRAMFGYPCSFRALDHGWTSGQWSVTCSRDPQSDIAILVGEAAIEFRTYYSGTSVITATSRGLTSVMVTITSQGSPAYVLGVTPPSPARPYSRYLGG